jgi:hypothetical protein
LGTSANSKDAWLALDGNPDTRWSTASPQRPGDYFEIKFNRSLKVLRIILSVIKNPSDFPRGIRVEAKENTGSYNIVFEKIDWLGPVYWTEEGYPYFGPQSDVVIDLPKEIEVSNLKFTQISKDSKFDWSIGEVKLFRQKN